MYAQAQDENVPLEENVPLVINETSDNPVNETSDNPEDGTSVRAHKLALNIGGGIAGFSSIGIPFSIGTGNVQIEYNFVDWFALGFDLTMGGTSSRHIFIISPQLTTKFMATFKIADLWAELGIGGIFYFGLDSENSGNTYDLFSARLKLGATFHITENFGIGFNFGLSNGTGFTGGLDLQYRF